MIASHKSDRSSSFTRGTLSMSNTILDEVFKSTTGLKSVLPRNIKTVKEPEKVLSQFETKSNANCGSGVNKFDPRDYVTHSKTIKTLGSLQKATGRLLNAQTTSRKITRKSKFGTNNTDNHRRYSVICANKIVSKVQILKILILLECLILELF
jgi:hypothetical protein